MVPCIYSLHSSYHWCFEVCHQDSIRQLWKCHWFIRNSKKLTWIKLQILMFDGVIEGKHVVRMLALFKSSIRAQSKIQIFLELALCEIELFLKKWFVYSYQICPYSQTIIGILNASCQKNVSKWPELCHWWSIWNGFWSRFVEPYILTYIIERIFVCIFVQPRIEIEYHWE